MLIFRHEARGSVIALALLASLNLSATDDQGCKTCASQVQSEDFLSSNERLVIRKDVNEVRVVFTASLKSKIVDNLTPNDINIRDDNKPPTAILSFQTQRDLPLRIGVLIDTSGSVESRFHFEQEAAGTFLRQTLKPNEDLAFILGFSDDAHLSQDFTQDSYLLSQGLEGLTTGGGTALYDAVVTACRRFVARPDRATVAPILIVLSDGEDNRSKISLKRLIDYVEQAEVTVYAISTQYDYEASDGNRNLKELSEQTGGRLFLPGDAKAVGKAFAAIQDELRSRYAVAYTPADFKPDGHFRRINIMARRLGRKLRVRARKGYFATLSSPLRDEPRSQ